MTLMCMRCVRVGAAPWALHFGSHQMLRNTKRLRENTVFLIATKIPRCSVGVKTSKVVIRWKQVEYDVEARKKWVGTYGI